MKPGLSCRGCNLINKDNYKPSHLEAWVRTGPKYRVNHQITGENTIKWVYFVEYFSVALKNKDNISCFNP
jgi:hypothetical protein